MPPTLPSGCRPGWPCTRAMHKPGNCCRVRTAAQGLALRSIRADAEAQVAHLDYAAAMDRFKAAQDLARQGHNSNGDYIEASIIDTRARRSNH